MHLIDKESVKVISAYQPFISVISGKKKSKFQTFKKFFARKKRKEASATGGDAGLKASQSSDNVSKTPEDNTLTRSEKDKGSGSKISLGSKALSHDSVFVSDSSEANEALGASQDSIHGKVKSLQLQLKQAIRLGSPPSLMCVKRMEDGGTMSEDDGLPCSPPEYSTSHTVLTPTHTTNSSLSLEGTDSDEDQLSCAASSRALSPLVAVPGDFSQPARPFACLDNSAAKHKLGLRQKACNKRKPVSRLEIRAEEDSVVEERLSTAVPKASEEQEEQETRGLCSQEDEWQREEAQEVMPEYSTKEEENSLFLRKSGKEEGEEAESEGEEETGNLEREPEVEEEEWEQREDDEEEEEREELERAEEAQEAEEAVAEEEDNREEMTNMVPDEIGEMVQTVMPALEADEGQDTLPEEDSAFTPEQPDRVQIHAEMCDQTENETAPNQNFVDEDGEERAEECIEIGQMEETSDQEEDLEMNQPDVDQSEEAGVATDQPDEDQEMSQLVVEDQRDIDQTDVDLMPPSVSAPDSQASSETRIQEESETSVPSPTSPTTSTTTLHINLVSPSSEKATCPLQQFFSGADTTEEVNQSSSHTEATAEQDETRQPPIAEQPAETAEEEEEEEKEEEEGKQSPATIEEAQPSKPPAAAEEAVTQPSSVSDQGKSRFIIAPAWQRSFSTGSGMEGVSSAKAEVVLSPVRTRSIGSAPAKPHSTTTAVTAKPQTSTAAAAEGQDESRFVVFVFFCLFMSFLNSHKSPAASPVTCVCCDVDSDPAASRSVSAGSDSPSWISVARQKQKIYKDSSLDAATAKKVGCVYACVCVFLWFCTFTLYGHNFAARKHKTCEVTC
uniref:DUF4592 domain-containing protein n=1 Tax=Myripristis murdjan TaxID=586833 RepID=A0A667YPD6_9TELE